MNNDVNERQKSVSKEIEYVCVWGGGGQIGEIGERSGDSCKYNHSSES